MSSAAPSTAPVTPRTVVCFGDSITYGQVSASYIEILEERLGPQGFRRPAVVQHHPRSLARQVARQRCPLPGNADDENFLAGPACHVSFDLHSCTLRCVI